MMNRRSFFKLTATHTGGALLLPQFLYNSGLVQECNEDLQGNRLIFIQLNGGNDGLNTFVPYENPLYYELRKNIGIPKDKLLINKQGLGLHPSLKGISEIMLQNNLSIIQNVGYPSPNRSHFRSQEIWQTASDSNDYINYGWLGRYLDLQCKDECIGGINIDNIDNLSLKSSNVNSITVKDISRMKFNQDDQLESTSKNPQLDFARKIAYTSQEGMEEITKAMKKVSTLKKVSYPSSPLAKNLQWIADLIKGNIDSKVFYTSMGGFDTHYNQLKVHERQLNDLDGAVKALYDDLRQSNLLDSTTIVLFSEFGRRAGDNGSGTDHGTAGPMMVIGGKNKGQIIGKSPSLDKLNNGDLIHDIHFREVYASLLKNKMNFDPKKLNINEQPLSGLF
jgi:uncharacterized protein (DUF1501 family)